MKQDAPTVDFSTRLDPETAAARRRLEKVYGGSQRTARLALHTLEKSSLCWLTPEQRDEYMAGRLEPEVMQAALRRRRTLDVEERAAHMAQWWQPHQAVVPDAPEQDKKVGALPKRKTRTRAKSTAPDSMDSQS